MSVQLKKGVLELCVLAALQSKDLYGYELVELISKHIDISEGTIYPLLKRLLDEKYFETYLRESDQGPPRKYYRITKQGKKVFAEQFEEWKKFVSSTENFFDEVLPHEQNRISQRASNTRSHASQN